MISMNSQSQPKFRVWWRTTRSLFPSPSLHGKKNLELWRYQDLLITDSCHTVCWDNCFANSCMCYFSDFTHDLLLIMMDRLVLFPHLSFLFGFSYVRCLVWYHDSHNFKAKLYFWSLIFILGLNLVSKWPLIFEVIILWSFSRGNLGAIGKVVVMWLKGHGFKSWKQPLV